MLGHTYRFVSRLRMDNQKQKITDKVLPKLKPSPPDDSCGAQIIGPHLEGPVISLERRGAHPSQNLVNGFSNENSGLDELKTIYGQDFMENAAIVTLAPELPNVLPVIQQLTKNHGLRVSLGLMLVTDAIAALGLTDGSHIMGEVEMTVQGNRAVIAGTNTLAGSMSSLDFCVRHLLKAARCSPIEAVECASLHPAEFLGITARKGTLDFGTDADFILLNDQLEVKATFIGGQLVWTGENS